MTSEEALYLLEHASELEESHAGKYIAIYKKKIVAEGPSIADVYRITDRKSIKKPLVTYVPKEGEEDLLI